MASPDQRGSRLALRRVRILPTLQACAAEEPDCRRVELLGVVARDQDKVRRGLLEADVRQIRHRALRVAGLDQATSGDSRAYATNRRGIMSTQRSGKGAGIGLGGILVIVGIILAIVWNVWIGVILALVGLIAFGGFVRGKWY
jgi:hypothetical protein